MPAPLAQLSFSILRFLVQLLNLLDLLLSIVQHRLQHVLSVLPLHHLIAVFDPMLHHENVLSEQVDNDALAVADLVLQVRDALILEFLL